MAEQTQHFIDALTKRESQILFALAEGMTDKEIASSLHIALATVKWNNSHIYSKLGIDGNGKRDKAVEKARSLGLLDTDDSPQSDIPNNLPQESTIFVGRNAELRELHELLNQAETRLISILAQGGMGKTRLALQLAKHNLSNFSDGIYLIQLAPIDSANAVPLLFSNTLGLQYYDTDSSTEDGIIKYLQSQKMLLIFDNFEHVLDSASLVSAILKSAPQVKIIVTSRERLNLQGEIVYTLSGMAVDNADNEAIELFIQSTQRIHPDYEMNDDDLPYIVEICRLVDGLPLGIELAAGWMDTLSAEEILAEIKKSIDILETELRDIPERHRSIQATLDYSWQTLSESEQETMMSLSLFRGGFIQEAAREVAIADIRRLKHLLNKSLLYRDPFGRYSIHELLRQFCFEKLLASGNYDPVILGFMEYMANFAQAQSEGMQNFDGNAFRAIQYDWENIAFAWHLMLDAERYDLIEKMHYSISLFSSMWGYSFECVELLDVAIARLEIIEPEQPALRKLRGKLLCWRGTLKTGISDVESTQKDLDEAVAILEQEQASLDLLHAYMAKFLIRHIEHDYQLHKPIAEKMIKLALQLKHYEFVIVGYFALWQHEEYVNDSANYQASLEYVYRIWEGNKTDNRIRSNTWARNGIIMMLRRLDKEEEAIFLIEENIFLAERAEWIYGISISRGQMIEIDFQAGRMQEVRNHILATLQWHQTHARDWQMLGALQGVHAQTLFYFEHYEQATEIYSYVLNHPVTVTDARNEARSIVKKLLEILDENTFNSAWERGKKRILKDVVDEAMAYWSQ